MFKTIYYDDDATNTVLETWEYVGGTGGVPLVLKDGQPYQLTTSEGRAIYQNSNWLSEFDYKDHLGNTRVSFKASGSQALKTGETAFDPWGVRLNGIGSVNAFQNRWEMQGKEKESTFGLNRINFGARTYNPTIGRFDRIDAMAEKMTEWSPYNYTFNNPIRFTDPDGNEPCCGDIGNAVGGFFQGVGESVVRNVKALTVDLPETIIGVASLASPVGQMNAAVGAGMLYDKTISDWNTGDIGTRANIVGNVVGEVAIAVAGTKGAGSLGKAGVVSDVVKVGDVVSDVSKVKSISQQAGELVSANANKNRVTLRSDKFKMDIDLRGETHFDKKTNVSYETPHTKVSPRNYQAPQNKGAVYNTTEKQAVYRNTTQQDIRTVRRYLDKKR